ncbi:hypothetical protein O181_002125 [Austropuccinia psidii MF-1]|uniref:Uncharacterized protein n=1 Tax=Austropuccinia psidii MF-1 TaxID=1389203 RepID=A0A9Q3BBU5_9BASI|nr:hypothetical protein [Austropuccinia psidii MF-1]
MTISAILSLKYNIPYRASCILTPALNLLLSSIISSSGGHPTPALHIPQDLTTIFEHLQLEQLIDNYIFFLNVSFLMALLNLSQLENPTFNTIMNQMIMIPLAHNHWENSSIYFNPALKKQPTSNKDLYQKIPFINHSKIGFPDFPSRLASWRFCIKFSNPKSLKVPPNVTSGMHWSGDASLAPEISMTPINVHSW